MKWLTATFAAFIVGIVILADRGQLPTILVRVRDFPGGDKVGHFLLIGTLSFLLNLSLHCSRWRFGAICLLKGSVLIAALATAEEFSQLAFASRSFSLLDLLADYAGILFFGWAAVMMMGVIRFPNAAPAPTPTPREE